jgi:prepilin signal peptidase PulO-like enzyme (type II secretory pathway)
MLLCDLPTKYQIELVKKNAKFIVFTLIVVWYAARFFNALSLSCQIDVFTVFFVVWQFIYLICKWHAQELPYFSFTLYQASLCIFTAFISYASYDIVLRYLPVQYKFVFLWLIAIQDW